MPFDRPDLKTLITRAEADLESRLPGTDAKLRRALLKVIARMHAGAMHGQYGAQEWRAKQILPDTAEAEFLERQASLYGITRKAATHAAGLVSIFGTDGSVIPAGTLLQRSDGVEYSTSAEAVIAASAALLSVLASQAGAGGNAASGTRLTLVSPIAGVQSQATVAGEGLTGGADIETDDSLRARVIARMRRTPLGGTAKDYEAWALEVPGVTRAWVTPFAMGPGTVTVRFMMDDTYANGIPQAADVDAVAAYIEERRPVCAQVFVVAPVAKPVDMAIRLVPNTIEVQDAVSAELEDLIRRDCEPGGTLLLSRVNEAISIAAGEQDHEIITPAADVVAGVGEICVLGQITWQG